jgi:hypothetical protein
VKPYEELRASALRSLGRVPLPEAVLSCGAADVALWLYARDYDHYTVKTELRAYGFSDARYFADIMRDPDGIRQHAEAEAARAEDPHRKGGWIRTLPRDELAEILRGLDAQCGDGVRIAIDNLRDAAPSAPLDAFDGVLDALEDDDVPDYEPYDYDLYDRLEELRDEVAREEPPRGVACPLVWRDDARATPAGNIAATEFVLRRIAQLRRDGYTREARALRPLLPERLEWRRWTGTLTDRDRRLIAEAETLAAAAREMIEQGGVLPFSEGADM